MKQSDEHTDEVCRLVLLCIELCSKLMPAQIELHNVLELRPYMLFYVWNCEGIEQSRASKDVDGGPSVTLLHAEGSLHVTGDVDNNNTSIQAEGDTHISLSSKQTRQRRRSTDVPTAVPIKQKKQRK